MSNSYFYQVINDLFKGDTQKILDYQTEFSEIYDKQDKKKLLEFFKRIEKEETDISKSKIKEIIDFIKVFTFNPEINYKEEKHLPDHIFHASLSHFPILKNGDEIDLINSSAVKIDVPLSYFQVRMLSKKIFNERFVLDNTNTAFVPFFITPEFHIKGLISSKLFSHKKEVRLGEIYISQNGQVYFYLLGDDSSKLRFRPIHTFSKKYYMYKFIGDDSKQYIVLSEEDITPQYIQLAGLRVKLKDTSKIGETSGITTDTEIIFMHHLIPDIPIIDDKDFKKISKEYTDESFRKSLFGEYRHPKWFERFIIAWLFSGKFSGFPLHIGIIGPSGTGKSALLESIEAQIPETTKIFRGTNSTFKGFVPSFSNKVPDEGHFARCRRIAYFDEFFACLKRNILGKAIADNDETALLQELLEHKESTCSSGRGGEIKLKPSAKLILTGNFVTGLQNILTVAEKISNPFLSRVLWYVQTSEHQRFIQDASDKFVVKKKKEPKQDKRIIQLYDYLSEINLEVNPEDVKRIYQRLENEIPVELKEIYRGRYKHHISCLIDGIAKYNSLIENRDKLEITQKDVNDAEVLFSMIVATWLDEIDFKKLPVKVRTELLNTYDRFLYDAVESSPGISRNELSDLIDGKNPDYRLNKLLEYEVIEKIDDLFYPHWHHKVRALRTGEGFVES